MHGITDFNCDCGAYAFREFPQTTAAEVAADLHRQGIDRMVMGSARAITFCSPQPANELLAEDAANGGPDGIRPLLAAVLNPEYPGAERDLRRCAELGFRALKLYPTYHAFDITSYETVRLADMATEMGWPVLLPVRVEDERHHHPLMKVPALPTEQAITFARDVPRAKIVLCAATTPEVTAFLQGVSGDQAYAEISYIKSPLNAIEDLVEHVGHERLLFGSHAPFAYAHTALAKVREAYISDEQKAAILGGNAARVLGE
ncbi:amidohydrolase [bacterium]|nr:amidohydrolase [bacterium]